MSVIELKPRAPSRLFLSLQWLPVLLLPVLFVLKVDVDDGADSQPHVMALVFAGVVLLSVLTTVMQFRTRYRLEKETLICDFWLFRLRIPRQRIATVTLVKLPFLGEVLRVRYRLLAMPKWQTLQLERPHAALTQMRSWLESESAAGMKDVAQGTRRARR